MSRPLTLEQQERAATLRADGVPASWIAEDIGAAIGTVQMRWQSPPGEAEAWRTDFQHIRRNPALYALHQEIAPKRRKGGL